MTRKQRKTNNEKIGEGNYQESENKNTRNR